MLRNTLLHFLTIQQQLYEGNIFCLLASRYLTGLQAQLMLSLDFILQKSALEK